MSNILGEPFRPWVKKQIEDRQSRLKSSTSISDETLRYLNSKTAWLKISSSVNLTSPDGEEENPIIENLTQMGFNRNDIIENNLAKNAVLYGGVADLNSSNKHHFGLNYKNSIFKHAYGWGGTRERGFVPMPGIVSITQNQYNRGALAKTIIKIKCWSREQLQILEVLYMRIGFLILAEWGWSMYLDENGDLKNFNDFNTKPYNEFIEGSSDQYDIWEIIEETRELYKGNYDATLGIVVNYKWENSPEGGYDVEIETTGAGDLIESLNISIPPTSTKEDGEEGEEGENDDEVNQNIIEADRNKTLVNQIIYDIYQSRKNVSKISTSPFALPGLKTQKGEIYFEDPNGVLTIPNVTTDIDENEKTHQIYITFGSLMAVIQNYFFIYDDSRDKCEALPLLHFDMNFEDIENDKNYILKFPGQFSSDPTICLVPVINPILPDVNLGYKNLTNTHLNKVLLNKSNWNDQNFLGKLASIYVNVDHIALLVDSLPKNEQGELKIINFLNTLIKDITTSLGGINRISIQTTPEGKIRFIEETPQRFDVGSKNGSDEYTFISLEGPDNGKGSFVRNFKVNSSIPSTFKSVAVAGAQVDGSNFPDSTSFSNYNKGLEDRVFTVRKDTEALNGRDPNAEDKEEDNIENLEKIFRTHINNESASQEQLSELYKNVRGKTYDFGRSSIYKEVFGDWKEEGALNLNFDRKKISTLSSNNIKFSKKMLDAYAQPGENQQIPSSFFIPFDLSMDLDGISGIKIFQKFEMDKRALPLQYSTQNFEVMINSINTSVNSEGWVTTLQGIPYPSFENLTQIPPVTEMKVNEISEINLESLPKINNSEFLESSDGNPLSRRNAMALSYSNVFRKYEYEKGMCARWTYNLAYNYTKFLENPNHIVPKEIIKGTGHANTTTWFDNVKKLGYRSFLFGQNVTTDELIKSLEGFKFNYGDIISYIALNGSVTSNPRKYGHVQIYAGSDLTNSTLKPWVSNIQTQTKYVYKSGISHTRWDVVFLRAPDEIV